MIELPPIPPSVEHAHSQLAEALRLFRAAQATAQVAVDRVREYDRLRQTQKEAAAERLKSTAALTLPQAREQWHTEPAAAEWLAREQVCKAAADAALDDVRYLGFLVERALSLLEMHCRFEGGRRSRQSSARPSAQKERL